MADTKKQSPNPGGDMPKQSEVKCITESFSPDAARFDTEAGIIKDALIFGPKDMHGPYFVSDSGRHYDKSFFTSLAEASKGALTWPYHPEQAANGSYKMRPVKDTIGKWPTVRLTEDSQGNPEVRGDFRLLKKCKEDYLEVCQEGADRFGFSIFAPTKTRFDESLGVEVHYQVAEDVRRKLSIDLVEASGATKTIFESASSDAKETTEEAMAKENTEQAVDVAALTAEATEKAKAAVLESLKPQLDESKKLVQENAALKRKNLITERLNAAKLDSQYISEDFRGVLESCPEDKIDSLIADRKKLVAEHIDPIKNAGGSDDAKGKPQMTIEHAIEVAGPRGLDTLVVEMAGGKGFATESSKDTTFQRRFAEEIAQRVLDVNDQSERTNALRKSLKNGYSIARVFEACYGESPRSDSQIRRFVGETSPMVASSFTAVNQALLGSEMIGGYTIAGVTLIGKQLVTIYNSPLEAERIPGFARGSGVDNIAEGAEAPDVAITPKYVTDYTLTKRGFSVVVTREAVLGDQTGRLLMEANDHGQELALDEEENIIKGILELGGKQVYRPTGVQTGIWNGVNSQESNVLANYTDLENAAIRLGNQVDENGKRLRDNMQSPLVILVPHALRYTAEHIVGAELLESGPNAANNMRSPNPFRGTRIFVSPVLDDYSTTTWYMAGSGGFQKQYLYKQRIPLEFVPLPAAEVMSVKKDLVTGIKGEYLAGVVARDNKYVVRNVSGTLSGS